MNRDFIPHWKQLGIVQAVTLEAELREHLRSGRRTIYAGFDPTADSLHIGHLLPLLGLRRAQMAGHRPIVLVGGATGLIGDPSGKAGERSLNDAETVAAWAAKLRAQASRFVDFSAGDDSALLLDNYEWTKKLGVISFLRDYGKHFTVSAMTSKESVKSRLDRDGAGISYTEFSYMILQAYDFNWLYENYGCTVQIGGSDQWGNITAGIDLIGRLHGTVQAYGVTLPLVMNADGTKFGKTESGAVWLDPAKTSPYEMYQFFVNAADADAGRYLRYFTFLPAEDIADLERALAEKPEERAAQRALASEMTRLVHGDDGLREAERTTEALFGNEVASLTEQELERAFLGAPKIALARSLPSVPVLDLLVRAKLAKSRARAQELVRGGGVHVNGQRVSDVRAECRRTDALFSRYLVVRKGKKTFHLARWE